MEESLGALERGRLEEADREPCRFELAHRLEEHALDRGRGRMQAVDEVANGAPPVARWLPRISLTGLHCRRPLGPRGRPSRDRSLRRCREQLVNKPQILYVPTQQAGLIRHNRLEREEQFVDGPAAREPTRSRL